MARQRPGYSAVHLDVDALADKAMALFAGRYPKVLDRYSPVRRGHLREDFRTQVQYFQESLATGGADIFTDYVTWARALFRSEGHPEDLLGAMLDVLHGILQEDLHPDLRGQAAAILKKGRKALRKGATEIPSFITEGTLSIVAQSYLDTLIAADPEEGRRIIEEAAGTGVPIRDMYLKVLQPVLWETGRLWQMSTITIAQEHFITASVQAAIALLHERVISGSEHNKRKEKALVAACVGDELHDVGIRMVADFFAMDGWDTYYIGGNIPAQSLVRAVIDRKADVVAISATMPFHISEVHYLIRSLRADPETAKVKIIVGGYPFAIVPDLWKQLGADAVAKDAEEAVRVGNRLTLTGRAKKRTV
ncbi:MAG: cobalamin-dependent protein [Methanomicrobiales archaeon]|nr:cobalamin-dependent protein [Methanomicrobiales archaeon]